MSYTIPAGTRIGHIHLKVADLERALKFYGVKPDGKPETPSKQALIDTILKFESKI